MQNLADLQADFAAAVWNDSPASVTSLLHDGQFEAARLFRVYRNNVFISLTAALAAVYPVIKRLVGDGFFDYAMDAYIRAHPPRSGNLHDFGAALADFLADFPPCADHAYLPDVARLEWAYHEVFHTPLPARFDPAVLSKVASDDYGRLRFEFSPAVRLVGSRYPVFSIWRANQAGMDEVTINLDAGGENVLVFRNSPEIEFKVLGPGEHALLDSLLAGATLQEASANASTREVDFNLADCLQHYVALGLVTAISVNQT